MVVPGWSRSVLAARAAASRASGWLSHQFITRNRRVAVGLALVTVFISVAAVHLSEAWFSPGLLILPVLAGGLLLWPRALAHPVRRHRRRAGLRRVMGLAGPGLIATIVVTALLADVLARTRKKLGMQGLRGNQMLIELPGQDPGAGDAAGPARGLGVGLGAQSSGRLLVRRRLPGLRLRREDPGGRAGRRARARGGRGNPGAAACRARSAACSARSRGRSSCPRATPTCAAGR